MAQADPTRQQIRDWWKQHEIPIQETPCPVCKADHEWHVDEQPSQIPTHPGTAKNIPLFVRVTCLHCGYVMLFDGLIAGLSRPVTITPDPNPTFPPKGAKTLPAKPPKQSKPKQK